MLLCICLSTSYAFKPNPAHREQQQILSNLLLAEIALERSHNTVTRDLYVNLAVKTKNPEIAQRAVYLSLSLETPHKALAAAKIWANAEPDNSSAQQIAANIYIQQGKIKQALPFLERLLVLDSSNESLRYFLLSLEVAADKNQKKFIKLLPSLEKKYHDNPTVLYNLASIQYYMNSSEHALSLVDQALKLQPQWASAIALRVQILRAQGDIQQAVSYLSGQRKLFPNDNILNLLYGELLLDNGQLIAAKNVFKKLLSDPKLKPSALLNLVQIAIKEKHLKTAKSYLKQLVQVPDMRNIANYLFGEIADFEGQYDDAIKYYQQITPGDYYLQARLKAAMLLTLQGRFDAAEALMQKTETKKYEEQKQVLLVQIEIMLQSGRTEQALATIATAMQMNPDDVQLIYTHGLVAQHMGRHKLVEQDMRRVLAMDAEHVNAMNVLAASLIENGQRYKEALKLLKKALALDPKNADVLQNMGWLQYGLGNSQQAIDYLTEAYTLYPSSDTALRLSEVLWSTGDQAGAQAIWDAAMYNGVDAQSLQQEIKRIKSQ